ncbi:hypothetical protein D0962_22370 [Leptolyngbyaceae cyanobacterium CCMR0082]|uniref:Uncharacterized protein n=2 Tax=Adonisia TaxID=2950183 RepID=A0A6M0SBN4_9CYAN|nr:hypothetical protein [Adonisia turfae CCMR0082]
MSPPLPESLENDSENVTKLLNVAMSPNLDEIEILPPLSDLPPSLRAVEFVSMRPRVVILPVMEEIEISPPLLGLPADASENAFNRSLIVRSPDMEEIEIFPAFPALPIVFLWLREKALILSLVVMLPVLEEIEILPPLLAFPSPRRACENEAILPSIKIFPDNEEIKIGPPLPALPVSERENERKFSPVVISPSASRMMGPPSPPSMTDVVSIMLTAILPGG